MAPTTKPSETSRRKSGTQKPTLICTLKVPSDFLRELSVPEPSSEDGTPTQDNPEVKSSPEATASQTAPSGTANGENATDSNAVTPQPEGTPGPGAMGPPADGVKTEGGKKKGVKRSAANANGSADGAPKQRGKPGPKKKPRLEDGTIDHTTSANRAAGGHKLGPKANQGAINAGLRALDRSGKPCRKWARGGFTLKSFTGVIWEVSRWTAPPKPNPESTTEGSAAPSADNSSGKENKEEIPGVSAANSNSGVDAEMPSAPPSVHASSPAPVPVTAAS